MRFGFHDSVGVDRGPQIAALRHFLLLHGAVRSWLWLRVGAEYGAELNAPLLAVTATVISATFALSFVRRYAYLAPRIALAALLIQLGITIPLTDNHFFIELLAVTLLSIVGADGSAADDDLAQRGLMWTTAIILFHTGLQKVLYGNYLHGDFIAFMIGRGGRFADLFAWMVPSTVIARLQSYNPVNNGAGPYRIDDALFVAVSNTVYLLELLLPLLLLFRPTRTAAALGAIALVAIIQIGALELAFALLFTNLLLVFLPGNWNRRVFPAVALLYLLALLLGLSLQPGDGVIGPTIL